MENKLHKDYSNAYNLYLEGKSISQVAILINTTRQSVFNYFKTRGLKLRKTPDRECQLYDGKKFTLRNNRYFSLSNGDRCLMHRYVWQKEKGIIPNGYDIHHIDGNRSNNNITNLECISKAEHTRKYSPSNNQYGIGKRPVRMISIDGKFSRLFNTVSIASQELNIKKSSIYQAIRNSNRTCKNHKWEYANGECGNG